MTRQVTVKLNHRKYRPLLDKIEHKLGITFSSDSELVGFMLFHCCNQDMYNNMKRAAEKNGQTKEQYLLEAWNKYVQWVSSNH